MKISVTNLGAIKEATVELGGLTVFVGPNGTGKSYLAKVLYGLRSFHILFDNYFSQPARFYRTLLGENMITSEEALAHFQNLTPHSLQDAIPALFNLHLELFKDKLSEYFNDDSNLFDKTNISFSEFEPLQEDQLKIIINASIQHARRWLSPQKNIPLEHLMWMRILHIFIAVNGGFADYFPAARSNFMLTYKELYRLRATDYVELDPFFSNNPPRGKELLAGSYPRKTGPLTRFDKPTEDFIRCLYDLDSSVEGPLADIANKLQNQLYGEDRFLVEQPEGSLPDFRYQVKNAEGKLRLHLTSSMVTETSPLLIGLKHWVQPNSLVIIDEPESHLHPEAQRALVNGLAEAVNQGLKVILITHSPYILSCVNNLIKFGSLVNQFPDDGDVKKLKDEHPDMVALEKPVHAYHFGRDGIVKDIVRESGLIDEAEFTEPFDRINDLYEAMRDIEWEHRQ